MWKQGFLVCSLLAFASFQALAFERPFPPIAKRGDMSMANYPAVMIDGKQRRLSPGAWIRNENNTIDMPASLAGREFTVNYTENSEGDVDRVWILNRDEARATPPNKRPENQWANQNQQAR
jgi:hypothetical protein